LRIWILLPLLLKLLDQAGNASFMLVVLEVMLQFVSGVGKQDFGHKAYRAGGAFDIE
jgi:hypothetical protein